MILIMGLPNSGKTTFSEMFDNTVHYDEIMNDKNLLHIISHSDICEGIFNTSKSRRKILEENTDNFNVCVWMDTPLDVCLSRESKRGRGIGVVLHQYDILEPPTLDEGWNIIVIIR